MHTSLILLSRIIGIIMLKIMPLRMGAFIVAIANIVQGLNAYS